MSPAVKYTCFLLLLFISVQLSYAQKEIFLRQIDFKLDTYSKVDYENEYFLTVQFNKGSLYRFKITNHIDNFAGEALFELYDADKRVLTNVTSDKYYEVFSFMCNKTGFYDILVKFKDRKPGNSVIDILLVQ